MPFLNDAPAQRGVWFATNPRIRWRRSESGDLLRESRSPCVAKHFVSSEKVPDVPGPSHGS